MRYVDNNFTNNFYNTIGVDFVINYFNKIENQIDMLREQKYKAVDSKIIFQFHSGIQLVRIDSEQSHVVIIGIEYF